MWRFICAFADIVLAILKLILFIALSLVFFPFVLLWQLVGKDSGKSAPSQSTFGKSVSGKGDSGKAGREKDAPYAVYTEYNEYDEFDWWQDNQGL